ncbi:MAG: ABC transporter ATP-binding protein [Candidatus Aminicenantes bacterium]|nr:ABC transporter ATP-binding protein [Candidatus Aminicenantes bacterium]
MNVVVLDNLRKSYGDLRAVDGVSFEVRRGEIFGMVGPNGAGKTTTIECLEGLRQPGEGSARVLDLDPQRDGYELRERIGVQLQQSALPDRLKVREVLDLFAAFYRHTVDWRPILDELGLAEKAGAPFAKLSGGQKQRLFIALALVNDPEVVFLDELTTGLDPQARRAMWDLVKSIRERGKTVFLTTHYMEEAEELCDRVAVMDHGRIVALDTPRNLIASLGAEHRVVFSVEDPLELDSFRTIQSVTHIERTGTRVVIFGRDDDLVVRVVMALAAAKIRFRDLRTEQPSLEDVFLSLTGKEMRD